MFVERLLISPLFSQNETALILGILIKRAALTPRYISNFTHQGFQSLHQLITLGGQYINSGGSNDHQLFLQKRRLKWCLGQHNIWRLSKKSRLTVGDKELKRAICPALAELRPALRDHLGRTGKYALFRRICSPCPARSGTTFYCAVWFSIFYGLIKFSVTNAIFLKKWSWFSLISTFYVPATEISY